jgi:hypothetical protein
VDNVAAVTDNPGQINSPNESMESTTIEFGSPTPSVARRDEMDKLQTSHSVALAAKQLEIDALKERLLAGSTSDIDHQEESSDEAPLQAMLAQLQRQLEDKEGSISDMKKESALQRKQLEEAGAQITR